MLIHSKISTKFFLK